MRGLQEPAHGAEANRDGRAGPAAGPGRRRYPSMKELQDMASAMNLEETSLNQLLRIAEESVQKTKALAQRGQLDLALVQYLRASDITVNMIPNHPDFKYMKQHHPRWADQFSALIMAVNSQQGVMENIKQKILSENNISGSRSRPSSRAGMPTTPPQRPQHLLSTAYNRNSAPVEPPLRMPSPSSFQASSNSPARFSQPSSPSRWPTTESQPDHNKPSFSGDKLAERFAELRNTRHNKTSAIYERNDSRTDSSLPPDSDSPSINSRNQASYQRNVLSQSDPPSSRLMGPRDMNTPHMAPPAVPPKVSLNTSISSFPRYPSPAYSPARLAPSQPPSNPPRTSTDAPRPLPSQHNPAWVGAPSGNLNGSTGESQYQSQTPNGNHFKGESRAEPSSLPLGPTIRAEQLMDCLDNSEVLLIDVRSRSDFDAGHILAKSIMSIEPVILRQGVSAEELEERLVISPEAELSLFARRDEFDLIVYYDQNTREASYLAGSPAGTSMPHLRALYDTLYEFNMYKPLKGGRQPTLLVGGIDAWVDLFGPQSLATSQTAAIMRSIRAGKTVERSGQPLRRVPTASANSSWEVRKKRLRDYRPLDKDEERIWLEKAKNEEIDPSSYGIEEGSITEEPEGIDEPDQGPISPFVQTYEDFLRRFPDPRDIQESMVAPASLETRPHLHDSSTVAPPSRPPPAVPRRSYGGVSDGRQTQPPLARQVSASKNALYTSSSMGRLRLPRTGLVNFGSTCYMNSIIQCLSAIGPLTMFFMDNRFHLQVQKNWKGSQGVLPGLYANLVRSLWKGDVESIQPTSFRKFAGRLNTEWAGNQQQDAKEFFDVLVDCLHEDLNVHWEKKPTDPLTFDQEMRRERMPIHRVCGIEWDRYCHRELSYISTLFAGQHASRLRCITCRNTSTTYEAFFSISVEIPTSGTGDIYQCLRSYCQEEMLSNDDVWKCPHCRCEREATKRIILTRAPRFLVIHLKRFSASRSHQARKIHTPVNFPLTGLDMSPFMLPPPSQNGDGNQASGPSPPQSGMSPNQLATSPPYLYNAYAVVRHLGGTMHEGHYISLVRDNARDCWRKFDDQRVTDFKPGSSRADNPANEQAYLVFYERALAS